MAPKMDPGANRSGFEEQCTALVAVLGVGSVDHVTGIGRKSRGLEIRRLEGRHPA